MGTFWVGSRSNIICFTDPDPRLASDKDLDNDVDQDEESIVLYISPRSAHASRWGKYYTVRV